MGTDRLSEILDLIEVRSVVSGGSALRGRWWTHSFIDDDLKFIAVARGHATLKTNGIDAPAELAAGDVAVLNGRSWLTLEGGCGEGEPVVVDPPSARLASLGGDVDAPDVLIGGRVELNPSGRELLLHTLPPVAHVSHSSAVGPQLRAHIVRLHSEMVADRVGADFAIRQYGQLLVLDVVRGFMQNDEMPAGWLKALADEKLRPALDLIHLHPSKGWSLADLAYASAMSRTSFAQRFRDIAGMPPQAYLINWRMLLAQRKLRDGDLRVGELAAELGYSSDSAFSTAFKKHHGESPLSYRARVRQVERKAAADEGNRVNAGSFSNRQPSK